VPRERGVHVCSAVMPHLPQFVTPEHEGHPVRRGFSVQARTSMEDGGAVIPIGRGQRRAMTSGVSGRTIGMAVEKVTEIEISRSKHGGGHHGVAIPVSLLHKRRRSCVARQEQLISPGPYRSFGNCHWPGPCDREYGDPPTFGGTPGSRLQRLLRASHFWFSTSGRIFASVVSNLVIVSGPVVVLLIP